MKNPVGFKVCAERCDECLFSKQRIVDEPRMRQVLADCAANDSFFVCHKHTLRWMDGDVDPDDAQVCCRAFYDRDPAATNLMRIAMRLGMRLVDFSGNEVEQP